MTLAPLTQASHAPATNRFELERGVLRSDGWWTTQIGMHNLTFTVANPGEGDHGAIGFLSLRLDPPPGRLNVPGPEPVEVLDGRVESATDRWTFRARNIDGDLEQDGVNETLEIEAEGPGIPPGGEETFTIRYEILKEARWTWILRGASSSQASERTLHTASVSVDTQAPDLELTNELPTTANTSTLWINGTLREPPSPHPAGLEALTLQIQGASPRNETIELGEGGGFAHRLDLLSLPEGQHEVRLLAMDRAGNDGGMRTPLLVDRTAPTTTWETTPWSNQRPVVLSWSVDDDVGQLQGVDLLRFVDGVWTPVLTGTLDTSLALENMLHGDQARFRLVATDTAGNSEPNPTGIAERDLALIVDLRPPEILALRLEPTDDGHRIILHAEDQHTGLAEATVSLLAENQDAGATRIARFNTTATDGVYTQALSHDGLTAGTYGLDVVVHDRAGNQASPDQALLLFVGEHLPVMVKTPLPPEGQRAFREGQVVTVEVTVPIPGDHHVTLTSTGLGLASPVTLRDDGEGADHRRGDRVFTGEATVRDGAGLTPLTIQVNATDGARGAAEILVPVDRSPPSITLLEPRPGQVGPEVTLRARITDDRYGPAVLSVHAGDRQLHTRVTPDPATGGILLSAEATNLPPGPQRLEVLARDSAGNEATAGLTVDVDATPPNLAWSLSGPQAPHEGWFTGSVRLQASASDPESGAEPATASIDGGPFTPLPLTITGTGPHEVRLTSTNGVGERNLTTLSVGIDAEPPSIQDARVEAGETGHFLTVGASDDVAVARVTAGYAGATHALQHVDGRFLLQLPSDLPDRILIEVEDAAGNTVTTTLKTGSEGVPAVGWFPVVLALLVSGFIRRCVP